MFVHSPAVFKKYVFFDKLNPQAPVVQKIVDEVISRHFQGEGVEFLMRIFWNLPI